MAAAAKSSTRPPREIQKSRTGIHGLDEVTGGGLPTGRPTLVCGGAGCGKTLLAMEFIVRGAVEFNEPGVFVMFEENAEELTHNLASLGFDLAALVRRKKLALEYIRIERSEIEETGEYDLEALFIRLAHAMETVGAKRIVLDTLEALFAGLPNHAVLRAELRRLFRWLKDRGMTAIVTGERGENSLTRFGLEEYVADCVIVLDHRVVEQVSTRRLRVLKYRGSRHGTNEYPFLIGSGGFSVLPITSLQLDHKAGTQRLSTGIAQLDQMLGGKGVYRGSSVLVSGAPGTGKSTVAASFASAACRRGERCLLFAYEESADQILRNMKSVGINLGHWIKKGLLAVHASRPTLHGLEQHLVMMHDLVRRFQPAAVVVDPISNLTMDIATSDIKPTLMRLIDFLKQNQVTALFTSLTHAASQEDSEVGVSSLMDTWVLLRNIEFNGERNRTVMVLKSRGMAHSNQVREFVLSKKGIDLVNVYLGSDRVLTGTARVAQEAQERTAGLIRQRERDRKMRHALSRQKAIAAQITALQSEAENLGVEVNLALVQEAAQERAERRNSELMADLRGRERRENGARKEKR